MVTLERQLEIREKAIDLLNNCKICLKKPISTYSLFNYIQCKKLYHIQRNLDGLLGITCYFPDSDEYLVITDEKANEIHTRHRFTICHEIGHVMLGHLESEECSACLNDKVIEHEANVFAEELLIPTTRILHLGFDKPEQIQNYFQVSYAAAKNKLEHFEENAIFIDYKKYLFREYNRQKPIF